MRSVQVLANNTRRLISLHFCLLIVFYTSPLLADPISEFSDINELKGLSDQLVKPDTNGESWFEPGSNYGRLFLEREGRKVMLSWLGTLSGDYKPQDYTEFGNRSVIGMTTIYRSKRNLEPPIKLEVILLHPRAKASRELNLIPEFTQRESVTKKAEHHEKLKIADMPADLGYNPELDQCSLSLPLPHLSMLYIETTQCRDGKKLVEFTDMVDIKRLIEKLER